MRHHPDHQVHPCQPESVQPGVLIAPAPPEARIDTNLPALEESRREAMASELEYLLKTHGDEEARSDQSSLTDVLSELRQLANDLGLDFGAALAGSDVVSEEPPTMAAFDPRI